MANVTLLPLTPEDREQFIWDNQEAFNYGALEEFGRRDDHFEEEGEIISRETIERSIDGGEAWRIWLDGRKVGGVVLRVEGDRGDLDLLFVSPKAHSKGIGYAAWCAVEKTAPGGASMGDGHALFREAQHPLLREPLRLPYRGVLQQPSSRPKRSGDR